MLMHSDGLQSTFQTYGAHTLLRHVLLATNICLLLETASRLSVLEQAGRCCLMPEGNPTS